MKRKGIFYTVSSALIFGIAPIFAGLSYHYGNTPMHMALLRNLLALPWLAAFILFKHLPWRLTGKQFGNILISSIFGATATAVFLYQAYDLIGVGTATTLHFLYPFLVCLGNHFLFGEAMERIRKICLTVCLTGIAFFLDPQSGYGMIGICLAIGSAISYAFYMIYLEKSSLTELNPAVYAFYQCLSVSLFLLLVNACFPFWQSGLSFQAYGLMLAAALGASVFATVLLNRGIALLGASEASIYSLLEPLAGIGTGILFLQERPSWKNLAGCLFILGAVLGMSLYERRNETET